MSRKEKNQYFHDKQPEIELLRLATHGIDMNLSPLVEDFRDILVNLESRKLTILFKWFWNHFDVVEFSNNFIKDINPDNLYWYISKLIEVTSRRRSLHWIERINLFHVFGLCRLIDEKLGLKIIESISDLGRKKRSIRTLSDLSAYNVALMLKRADTLDSLKLIAAISDPSLLAVYGAYQIYYYGSFSQLLGFLRDYKNSPKQVIIPQTIAGLFISEPSSIILAKNARERIYDEILIGMPKKVIRTLEKLDKKYEISIKTQY